MLHYKRVRIDCLCNSSAELNGLWLSWLKAYEFAVRHETETLAVMLQWEVTDAWVIF